MRERLKKLRPVILFFIIINALAITGRNKLEQWGMSQDVVILGNTLLFLITLISFSLAWKGLSNPNPHAFVRSVYSSMLLKLVVCAIAAFIYISASGQNISKPALFTCMGLYLVYTFMEVSILTNLLRNKPNA